MNIRLMLVVLRKELLDLARDRRTLVSLVVAPMLVGPVLMYSMNYYLRRTRQQANVERFRVGMKESVAIPGLRDAFAAAGLEVVASADPRRAVEEKKVTFGVESENANGKPVVRLFLDNSDMTSSMGRSRLDQAIEGVSRARVRSELAKHNVPEAVLDPFVRQSVNVAKPRQMTGSFVGGLIGFMLLIFLFNGAMYAAVDATAGEKERKTLEVLLSSAVGRTEIVTGKIGTALVTSFGTTALTIASHALALSQVGDQRDTPVFTFPTDPLTFLLLVVLILPVAVLAASVAIAGSIPAKSSREAMSYMTPGLFIVMFLGTITFVPSLEKNTMISLVPFANFTQMLRQVLSGDVSWMRYGLTVGSNLLYSAIAAWLAVRNFSSEKVLFRT